MPDSKSAAVPSTPPNPYLVDANAYFRLAKCGTAPLFGQLFAIVPPLRLVIYPELEKEFAGSARLASAFPWFHDASIRLERHAAEIAVSNAQKNHVIRKATLLKSFAPGVIALWWNTTQAGKSGRPAPVLSRADLQILAYASVLSLGIVTDEGAMTVLAKASKILVMTSLDVLMALVEGNVLTKQQLDSHLRYLIYWREDKWPRWKVTYRTKFGVEPPDAPEP